MTEQKPKELPLLPHPTTTAVPEGNNLVRTQPELSNRLQYVLLMGP